MALGVHKTQFDERAALYGKRHDSFPPLVLIDLLTEEEIVGHSYVFPYMEMALKPLVELLNNMETLIHREMVHPSAITQKLRLKAKIGYPTVREDIEVIKATRMAVGENVLILVAYNQCLSVSEALEHCRALDALGLT